MKSSLFTTAFILLMLLGFASTTLHSAETMKDKNTYRQGYAPVNGASLYYQVFSVGRGTPIILIHGGPGINQEYLLPQMKELAKDHELCLYDQRGSGKSWNTSITEKEINIPQFVEDLEMVRKHLGYDKFVLMGHSWGGRLAMEYAVVYPNNISTLVLLNTNPATYTGHEAFVAELMKRYAPFIEKLAPLIDETILNQTSLDEIKAMYRSMLGVNFVQPEKLNELTLEFESIESARNGIRVSKIMNKSEARPGFDLRKQLSTLQTPTLLIHTDKESAPIWTAEEIKAALPNAELVVIKNCGHFPYIEKPNEYFSAIRNFLEKNHL